MKIKSRLFRSMAWFFLGYAALFALRLGYGYISYPEGSEISDQRLRQASAPSAGDGYGKKNYASARKDIGGGSAIPAEANQKYEKKGIVSARTTEFDADEKKARALIAEHKGLVQYERGSGTRDNRQLQLSVGVAPSAFDGFFQAMHGIGKLTSSNVTRVDKTNEFLALKAKRISLEKTLAGLTELKSQRGEIPAFIELQGRILEVEKELQELGVSLGEFDETNSFCTVNFSLYEQGKPKTSSIGLVHRVKVAMVWSAEMYGAILFLFMCTAFSAFLLLLVLDKLNALKKVWETLNTSPR